MNCNEWSGRQQAARELLGISPELLQIFQDQCTWVQGVTAQNLVVVDAERHLLSIAGGIWNIHLGQQDDQMLQFSTDFTDLCFDQMAGFILSEIIFYTEDESVPYSTTLKHRAGLLRQVFIEQVFEWVNGDNRIRDYLEHLSVQDAEQIDRLLMGKHDSHVSLAEFLRLGKPFTPEMEQGIKNLCLVDALQGESFIPLNVLSQQYGQLCLSARRLLPEPLFRVVECYFGEQFRFVDISEHQQHLTALIRHAREQPQLMGFTRLMKPDYWPLTDLFSRQNFLDEDCPCWIESLYGLSICHFQRTANWLFKQDALVADWISRHIGHAGVRVSMTALSFVDSSRAHPQVILLTLRYFKDIASRLFLHECAACARQYQWFSHPANLRYCLEGSRSADVLAQRTEISQSILYMDEWMDLLRLMSRADPQVVRQVYHKISRVIQAYMQFLQQIIQGLPEDLIRFIDPVSHQQPQFFLMLKKHQIKVDEFRKRFRHPTAGDDRSVGIFESYVNDYLLECFYQRREIARNVTWAGLFQQARKWHRQIQYDDLLNQLQARVTTDNWARVSPMPSLYHQGWRYEELHCLTQIIQESVKFRHCLALSYSERIAEHEYIAFHMHSVQQPDLQLTLGCHLADGQLSFEQIRLSDNAIPGQEIIAQARSFIAALNHYLIQQRDDPAAVIPNRFQRIT
ncbi:hypothetical protein [Acinetobacter sp. WZC-1]|uniref:hypothetical protein n=1 Tax=Acinetobacter sp. WZC-1 TaxID=3459034 RepID=UPI00403E2253